MTRSRYMAIGLAILGGFAAVSSAQCESRPNSQTRPYRGVVEGDGSGFIEEETDTQRADQEVLNAIDIAHGLMSGKVSRSAIGHYSIAQLNQSIIEAYETHMSDSPKDWYSMREYALALILDKQYKAGFKKLEESYLGDPAMTRIPMNKDLLGEDGIAMKKLAERLVRYAKKNDSGDAWFAVAMILQARGDLDHAEKNLERAKTAGIEEWLFEAMGKALGAKERAQPAPTQSS